MPITPDTKNWTWVTERACPECGFDGSRLDPATVAVRGVCALYDRRLALMLTEDGARFENWDQDVTAVDDDYNAQDPSAVIVALQDAAFTVDTFARSMIHDPVHHVHDVRQGLDRLRAERAS